MRYMVQLTYLLDTNFRVSKSFSIYIYNLYNLGRTIEELRLSQTTYSTYLNIVDINIWKI